MKQLAQLACLILACYKNILDQQHVEDAYSMKQLAQLACLILACCKNILDQQHVEGACSQALVC